MVRAIRESLGLQGHCAMLPVRFPIGCVQAAIPPVGCVYLESRPVGSHPEPSSRGRIIEFGGRRQSSRNRRWPSRKFAVQNIIMIQSPVQWESVDMISYSLGDRKIQRGSRDRKDLPGRKVVAILLCIVARMDF